jgi:hypothetical protein
MRADTMIRTKVGEAKCPACAKLVPTYQIGTMVGNVRFGRHYTTVQGAPWQGPLRVACHYSEGAVKEGR